MLLYGGMQFIVLVFWLFILASFATRILFAIAAYNDACSKMNPNAVMWGILIGVFGLIPGVIYLCIRNNTARGPVNCPKCGLLYHSGYQNCPQCGEPNPFNYMQMNPFALQQKQRAKKLCVAAAVIIGASVFIFVLCLALFIAGSSVGVFYN